MCFTDGNMWPSKNSNGPPKYRKGAKHTCSPQNNWPGDNTEPSWKDILPSKIRSLSKKMGPPISMMGPPSYQSWVPRTPKHSTWCKTLHAMHLVLHALEHTAQGNFGPLGPGFCSIPPIKSRYFLYKDRSFSGFWSHSTWTFPFSGNGETGGWGVVNCLKWQIPDFSAWTIPWHDGGYLFWWISGYSGDLYAKSARKTKKTPSVFIVYFLCTSAAILFYSILLRVPPLAYRGTTIRCKGSVSSY